MPKTLLTRIEKPWGYELIWAHTPHYVGKILHICKGKKLSLQYHRKKDETIFIQSGSIHLIIQEDTNTFETILLQQGDSYHIPCGTQHRFIALEDSNIHEVSTSELGDVVRLADDYGRS